MWETVEATDVETIRSQMRRGASSYMLISLVLVGCVLMLADLEEAPLIPFFLGILVLAVAGIVWRLSGRRRLAAWAMSLGIMGLVWVGWYCFPASDVYHALSLSIISAAVLLAPSAGFVVAGLANVTLLVGMSQITPLKATPNLLIANSVLLWITAFWMYVAQHPQGKFVAWAWRGYEQARRNLGMARDRQVELKQALADLALATRQTVRLNEMLSSARDALEEARQAKQEFVANVSHELRTPLNMIIGFSDMILESPEVYSDRLPPALLADVAAIKRNSQHLASLVDDVLSLAEADTGHVKLSREHTLIQEIAQEAAEAVSALFEKKGLYLKVEIHDDLSPIYCDRTRIRQVIINLLSNTGRFTEEGGAVIKAGREKEMILVSV
jgi:signal transduction histidine kinase